jgi:CBS domain-containing protein
MTSVRELLKSKGTQVWALPPEASVYTALRLMADKNVGAVVVQEQGKLVGIFTERDYARKVILLGKQSKDLLLSEIMTSPVITVTPRQSLDECMALMTRHNIRHLPVIEDEQPHGLISIRDVVQRLLAITIQRLETYVLGTDTGL